MSTYLLGIDIGTSACKAALFTPDGVVAAQASAEYPVYYPQTGWAEQNPEEWWTGAASAIRSLLAENGIVPGEIAGIGVDGQSWSAIPVDRDGRLLANTPIWFDTRSQGVCRELRETVGEDAVFGLCGNPLQPGYSSPKIAWFRRNCPEVYRETRYFLQSNAFIVHRLTGAFTQDLCQAYGLHCFDIRKGKWDAIMAKSLGIDVNLLPEPVACHQVVGYVNASAAAFTGLAEGTPVVAGGLDAACGSLGAGVLAPGETQEQGGQAGGMSICTDKPVSVQSLILSNHVVPDRWLLQGGTVGGGGIMRWLELELGAAERTAARVTGRSSFAEMDKAAGAISPGSEGVVFLPYMAGERSPIWNSRAKGVFYGLDYSKTRAHMFRAGMEGVVFSLLHNLETAEQAGIRADVLRSMGGAATSKLWTQMKADATGKRILVPDSENATTLGAALLAGVGTGVYKSFDEAVSRTVKVTREHEPNPAHFNAYRRAYDRYRALYEHLEPMMKESVDQ